MRSYTEGRVVMEVGGRACRTQHSAGQRGPQGPRHHGRDPTSEVRFSHSHAKKREEQAGET